MAKTLFKGVFPGDLWYFLLAIETSMPSKTCKSLHACMHACENMLCAFLHPVCCTLSGRAGCSWGRSPAWCCRGNRWSPKPPRQGRRGQAWWTERHRPRCQRRWAASSSFCFLAKHELWFNNQLSIFDKMEKPNCFQKKKKTYFNFITFFFLKSPVVLKPTGQENLATPGSKQASMEFDLWAQVRGVSSR